MLRISILFKCYVGIFLFSFSWQLNKTSLLTLAHECDLYPSLLLFQFNYCTSFCKWHMLSISSKCNHFWILQEAPCWSLTVSTWWCIREMNVPQENFAKFWLRALTTWNFKLTSFIFFCSINIVGYCSYFHFFLLPWCVSPSIFNNWYCFLGLSEIIIQVTQEKKNAFT